MHKLIDNIVETLAKQIKPQRIYLFGSHAKDTARPDSDIDLLIIADIPGPKYKRSLQVRKLFPLRCFSLDVLVYKMEEFKEESQVPNTMGYIVARQGKLLYEQ